MRLDSYMNSYMCIKSALVCHNSVSLVITCARGVVTSAHAPLQRTNYITCAIISILAHATQFNPLSQHLSIFVRFVSAVTLTCGILAAVRRFSAG